MFDNFFNFIQQITWSPKINKENLVRFCREIQKNFEEANYMGVKQSHEKNIYTL